MCLLRMDLVRGIIVTMTRTGRVSDGIIVITIDGSALSIHLVSAGMRPGLHHAQMVAGQGLRRLGPHRRLRSASVPVDQEAETARAGMDTHSAQTWKMHQTPRTYQTIRRAMRTMSAKDGDHSTTTSHHHLIPELAAIHTTHTRENPLATCPLHHHTATATTTSAHPSPASLARNPAAATTARAHDRRASSSAISSSGAQCLHRHLTQHHMSVLLLG